MSALFRLLLICMCVSVAGPAYADDDHDRAREAMKAGLIRPLSDALGALERAYEGEVLEVELEELEDEYWNTEGKKGFVYEFKLLTPQGNVLKLYYDANSLELYAVDGHDADKARRDDDD